MAAYALLTGSSAIQRTDDGAFIAADVGNVDYRAYLAWVAQGNTPDPAPVPSATATALLALEVNDGLMFRALEVLIDVLLAKSVIVATDFTPAVRALYQARKALRVAAGTP